ncbi:MAG TPA: hypothetical protein VMC61_07300, partial [Methanocella sp.]|nr:hypothetical protein [Methanocella sp.]
MKMDWNRIVLTTLLVLIISSLVLAPTALAARVGGGMAGGGMGIRSGMGMGGGMGIRSGMGMGIGGIHTGVGGISNVGGFNSFGGIHDGISHIGIHDGIFRNRFIGTGFGGWPWWNNWGWNNWGWNNWGWPWGGSSPCFTNCVSQGYDPGYCS